MSADDISTAVSPESEGPQCAFCHQFGAELVQDALSNLEARMSEDGFSSINPMDVRIVMNALKRHHGH